MKLEDFYTIKEAAEALNVTGEAVRSMCRQNKIPATKVFNMWLIEKTDLHQFAATYTGSAGAKRTLV